MLFDFLMFDCFHCFYCFHLNDLNDFVLLSNVVLEDDLLVVVSARRTSMSFCSELEDIPVDVWLIGHTHVPFPRDLTEVFTASDKIFNAGTHVQTRWRRRACVTRGSGSFSKLLKITVIVQNHRHGGPSF